MSEHKNAANPTGKIKEENNSKDGDLPIARIHGTPWRGWIWSVPLAAMILIGFLAVRTWIFEGETVTVIFPEVRGLNPKATSVFYKGVQIGTLETVNLVNHDKNVAVTLTINSSASALLRKGTRFWIQQPDILNGDLAGLISGPDIQMIPGQGAPASKFQGLLHRPDIIPSRPGRMFIVAARRLGNLHHGSRVSYRGLEVGKLLGWTYNAHDNQVKLKVFIRAPFDHLVNANARFWRVGSLSVRSGMGGLNFNIPPLSSLLNGAIAFDTVTRNRRVEIPAAFHLYSNRNSALHGPNGPSVIFASQFSGPAAGLQPGSPVEINGITVGQVRTIGLQYNSDSQMMTVPVTFALYPEKFGIPVSGPKSQSPVIALKKLLAQLVNRGLRAQLNSSNPLLGGEEISLVMIGKKGKHDLDLSVKSPEIPSTGAGGISGIIASVNEITKHLNRVPLEQIGRNFRALSARLNALAASPKIMESITHLDKTLANAQSITTNARGHIEPTIASLRNAAQAAATMAKTITRVTGGGPDSQADIKNLVSELTRTARAIRTLANYLDRHPGALIYGRSK